MLFLLLYTLAMYVKFILNMENDVFFEIRPVFIANL